MTSALQNRLVGTIIVVALVVILVPEFLDGEKRINKQQFVEVPPVAELVKVQNIEPFDTSQVESQLSQAIEVIDETPVDAEVNKFSSPAKREQSQEQTVTADVSSSTTAIGVVAAPAPAPIITQKSKDIVDELSQIDIKDSGWVVQLGSFRHQKNVKELMRTLNVAGYRAYTRPVMTSMGELTKVFVGPELDKEKLELALPHLKEITKLKGKITAFEVSAG